MPLPPGWVPRQEESSARTYYWNQHSNETTWQRPSEPADPALASQLVLRQAAAAAAPFVRCPQQLVSLPGYHFKEGPEGTISHARLQ